MSLHFNHIASCRKSRYHCPCHKSDKKASRHTLFQETAGGYSASAVLYSYDFYSNSATHSKCRGTTPFMSEVFNFFVFRNYPQNRFEGSCPLVFFSPINWALMIYFYPKYGITDWNKKAITIDNPKTTANSFGFLYKIIIPSIHVITSIRLYI